MTRNRGLYRVELYQYGELVGMYYVRGRDNAHRFGQKRKDQIGNDCELKVIPDWI